MNRYLSYYGVICILSLTLLWSCEKDNTPVSVSDIDGNIYPTLVINNQVWMAENLRTTRFNDGEEIKLVTKNQEWMKNYDPGFAWYNNDSSMFKVPYGGLYNAFAAMDERICPEGWHVPSLDEIRSLATSLGDSASAGGKLKVEGLSQWHSPNTGASNSSGFSALPAGLRYFEGTFSSLSYFTAFWTKTEADSASSYFLGLSYLDATASISKKSKKNGFSIRCIKD